MPALSPIPVSVNPTDDPIIQDVGRVFPRDAGVRVRQHVVGDSAGLATSGYPLAYRPAASPATRTLGPLAVLPVTPRPAFVAQTNTPHGPESTATKGLPGSDHALQILVNKGDRKEVECRYSRATTGRIGF